MTSCTILPSGYEPGRALNVAKNKPALRGLTLAGLPLFVLCGWLFLRIALAVRPDQAARRALGGLITPLLHHGFAAHVSAP